MNHIDNEHSENILVQLSLDSNQPYEQIFNYFQQFILPVAVDGLAIGCAASLIYTLAWKDFSAHILNLQRKRSESIETDAILLRREIRKIEYHIQLDIRHGRDILNEEEKQKKIEFGKKKISSLEKESDYLINLYISGKMDPIIAAEEAEKLHGYRGYVVRGVLSATNYIQSARTYLTEAFAATIVGNRERENMNA